MLVSYQAFTPSVLFWSQCIQHTGCKKANLIKLATLFHKSVKWVGMNIFPNP